MEKVPFAQKMEPQQLQLKPEKEKSARTLLPKQKPTVIILGHSLTMLEVAKELQWMGIDVKRVNYVKELKHQFDGTEVGIIYVAPLNRSDIHSVHKNLQKKSKFKNIPFFATVPDWMNSREERQLYQEGIRMIFEWPKEREAFSRILSTSLVAGTDKVASGDTDKSLEVAVHNRLIGEYGFFAPEIRTYVYHGIVLLRGEVGSIARKKNLVETVKKIPGVRGVVDASLKVQKSNVNPQLLKKTAAEVLKKSVGINEQTLDVKVNEEKQALVLTGTSSDQKKVEKAKEKLEKLHGIQEVKDHVLVSPKVNKQDSFLARRAQRLIKKMSLDSQSEIVVKVTSGVAHLQGFTNNKNIIEEIDQALEQIEGIKKIENEVRILQNVS